MKQADIGAIREGSDVILSPQVASEIARDATIYGVPLVENYRIQHSFFEDRRSPDFKAPWNQLKNVARVFTPEDRTIQTPNSDTPYSHLGADLRGEPLVITVPEVRDRYYSIQFVDMYTHNFAYVGSRSTGSEAGSFLLAGPSWRGEAPSAAKLVLRSETQFAFVQYRTQLFKPDDLPNVEAVQARYRVEPLSQFMGEQPPPPPATIDFMEPLKTGDRTSTRFFDILNFVLSFCPTHPSEMELMERFRRLRIGSGQQFRFDAWPDEIQIAIREGMADAWEEFESFKATEVDTGKRPASEGFGTREFLRNDYMGRMSSAVLGIYGNSKEEALYPAYFVDSGGRPMDGARRYHLRFAPGSLPPVNSFWSLTMYELPTSLLYANPLERYLINSTMLPQLVQDADGGLTILIQHEAPDKRHEPNWLPAPEGPFWVCMRLYWPKAEALDGRWKEPRLERLD